MPQVFRIGGYWVYFWSDESIIEARSLEVTQKWEKHFGEIRYYC